MVFTRFIYALYAEGDKTIRYIGHTDNRKRRLKQHLDLQNQVSSVKTAWLWYCRKRNIQIRMRTLRVIEAGDYDKCREAGKHAEKSWIDFATNRGVRLVNGNLWVPGSIPNHIGECWIYLTRRVAHAYRENQGSPFQWLSAFKERRLIRLIEEAHPELRLDRPNILRAYKLPLSA